MANYSDKILEEIKSRLRLSDVIGSYVRLKRQGGSEDYKACCPFHQEKTPSFIVHDDKGFYKCFGCQKSGNMFTFLMDMEHITFPQAVEELAKKAHVELKEETPQEKTQLSKQKALSDLYNRICKSYHHILLNNIQAQHAREYLNKRGISTQTCDRFMLGYAFENPSWLYNFLKQKDYSDELIRESGLFSKNYDKFPLFRNRILFPIRNWQGNCVAFSGRDLGTESKAKYVNSPETAIYSKRSILFGFYESLPELKKRGEIILCEGNFDVISLHQAGIEYACAPLGTAFTQEQAQLIKRYCTKVSLLFDSDSAGENATFKAIIICQKNDLECYVVKPFRNAKDASQVLEEQGAEALKSYVSDTETAISYLVHSALKRYDTKTPKGKLSVLKEVSPYLDVTTSEIERQGYLSYLSESLHVSEEELTNDYKRRLGFEAERNGVKPDTDIREPLKATAELNALLLVLNYRQGFEIFRKQIKINNLNDENAKAVYTVLEDCTRRGDVSDEEMLNLIQDERLRSLAFDSLSEKKGTVSESDISDAVRIVKLENLLIRRAGIISMINSSDMERFSSQEVVGLLEAKNNLDREIEELKKTEDF